MGASSAISRTVWAVTTLLLACLIAAYYQILGVEAQFLRAESGYYIEFATQDWNVFWDFAKWRLLGASNGHYAPFAFNLELLQARLIGSHDRVWFVRQILLMASLVASVAAYAYLVAPCQKLLAAAFLGTIVLLQPIFIDLVSWPFMSLQLLCCLCIVVSTYGMIRFSESGQSRDLWWYLSFAYLSMHFSGVGLAFSVAALIVGMGLVFTRRIPLSPRLIRPFIVICTLVFIHAIMMTVDPASHSSLEVDINSITKFGIAFWSVIQTGAQAVLGVGSFAIPNVGAFPRFAIYGLVSAACIIAICGTVLIRAAHDERVATSLGLLGFPSIAALIYAALVAARPAGAHNELLVEFFFGGRYVIFTFTITILFLGGLIRVGVTQSRASAIVPVIVVLSIALAIHAHFVASQMKTVWAPLFISHRLIWSVVLDATADAIKNGRPAPNLLLPKLGEFGFEARRYEALIKRDLGIAPNLALRWTPAVPGRPRE